MSIENKQQCNYGNFRIIMILLLVLGLTNTVFRGDDCGNLSCVGGNNDFCISVNRGRKGEMYYILVHGSSSNDSSSSSSSSGDFKLTISTDAERKDNDFCGTATEVVPGDSISFTFFGFYG